MNKHSFRLIFSKSLGFLIPVAEITRAQRKPGQQPTVSPAVIPLVNPTWSLKRLVLSVLLAGLPSWAAAEIVVDPNNPSGTGVVSAPNGVPVIEIANPNDKGLSHNRFNEFDVQQPGVIFNNSLVNGVSRLGGAVLLNPRLQRSATAILTEVTGNKPSSIAGTLEVFGAKADLIIAELNKRRRKSLILGLSKVTQALRAMRWLVPMMVIASEVSEVLFLCHRSHKFQRITQGIQVQRRTTIQVVICMPLS